jgi:tetratricopeptide (TPR) repeat protein
MKTIVVAILSMVSFAGAALAQVNYSAFQVSQQQLLEGVPQNLVQRFIDAATAIHERPTDINAQIELAAVCLDIANRSHYSFQWIHYAAKTLEQVLRQNPNNFMARHDYAMACFQEGDLNPAQPVMRLAITHFKKAIALKPDSARSYMGRGWAYLMLDDSAHAQADFNAALQIDPSLRNELENEARAIAAKRAQKPAVEAMMRRLGSYVVNSTARTAQQCAAIKGYWTNNECRISTAMAPFPVQGAH